KRYAGRGVTVIVANPNAHQSPEEMRSRRRAAGLGGRYLHDTEGSLARTLGAESSTDVFVLDPARTLVYRGAADDQFGIGYSLPHPRRRYLVEAIEAALSGTAPEAAATSAPACALELKPLPQA